MYLFINIIYCLIVISCVYLQYQHNLLKWSRREWFIMQRHTVSSSRIDSVGWENNVLEIKFPGGLLHQYADVSKAEYDNFLNSASLGSALSRIEIIHHYHRV